MLKSVRGKIASGRKRAGGNGKGQTQDKAKGNDKRKARKGLYGSSRSPAWTAAEVTMLRQLAARQLGGVKISKALKRSVNAVRSKALVLQLSLGPRGGKRPGSQTGRGG
jgi:hypothetical protein